MIGWLRRLRDDFKAEYRAAKQRRAPQQISAEVSARQSVQSAVDMLVWRAKHPCPLHEEFDYDCQTCHDAAHCRNHEEFDPDCVDCTSRKTLERLGTVAHRHRDPEKQAAEADLGKGQVIWRD